MKERIQKVLAAAGVDSRRKVEEMILQGRVAVNGKTVYELPVLIDPEKDHVEVDGERIRLRDRRAKETRVYVIMNKPKGIYSTNVAQGEQRRAIDLLPPGHPRLYPVGRLDADSKGLLLLTNDGDLTNRLTHPRYGVSKTYRAIVDGWVDQPMIDELSKGIWLADKEGAGFKTGRTFIKVVKRMREKSVLEIIIREGRNRQVRRMLAKIGHKVKDLTRVKMGPLTLEGLKPGDFRELTARELKELQKYARNSEKGKGEGKGAKDRDE
ncbi:MAG TPA: pseudouridine synthase [Tepidisphaeraceae bacterium]|nr:pseudouridine synthase [Tepidisphaeraceae bacterium]